MASKIYFITESRLKDFTTVLGNVDAQLISPLIPTLAAMWVESRVGSYFYDHLLTVYNAETANAAEVTLITLIQQSLLWRAAADVYITTSGQITNKGPQDQNGINSSASDLNKIGLISRHYTNKAEFFDSRIEAHLRLNKADYPEFIADANNNCTIVDIVPEDGKGYNRDITFF
jgi:hypothetical protein